MRRMRLLAPFFVVAVLVFLANAVVGSDSPDLITTSSAAPELVPAGAVSVSPTPGTVSASRATQISFRGVSARELGEITVTGSKSGRHSGDLRAHSDGKGASFIPDAPFEDGERVDVHTDLLIAGGDDGDFDMTIARHAPERAIRAQDPPEKGNGATLTLASRPDLVPPAVTVTRAESGRATGDIFIAPKGGRGQDGPMIVDDRGRLVWFKPMPQDRIAADFRAQTYEGRPVLTWWEGGLIVGDGRGSGVIYDQHYRPLKIVNAGNGYSMDLHEFTLTPEGTALVIAYDRVRQDLSDLGGPADAVVVDGIVQEIDVNTGLIIFEWHSLGHVGLDESKTLVPKRAGGEFDYAHLNSVALDENGDFIVSARNTWGIYKIDRATGQIAWRLGGTKPSLDMGEGTLTAWQHHARPQPDGTITIFDNGASPKVHDVSRVTTVRVDERKGTAALVSELEHPDHVLSATQGSAERLPNGDTFVGYGSQRFFSEYAPDGRLLFDAQLARGNDSYRAFRLPWEGSPAELPDVVATTSGDSVTAHVSWNGATAVARWELLAGSRRDDLEPIANSAARDFEVTLRARTTQRLIAARALDAQGKILAMSTPTSPRSQARP